MVSIDMVRKRIENWPPDKSKWPSGISAYPRGWCAWHRGQKRHVAGKGARIKDLPAIWAAKRKAIDTGGIYIPTGETVTVRQLIAGYLAATDRAVDREELSDRQRQNRTYECNRFGRFVGGDTPVVALSPSDFSAYRVSMRDHSPMSVASTIARITAMFNWGMRNGVHQQVIYGDDWRRPHRSKLRDRRMSISKSFSRDEIELLFGVADPMWRCWLALGVCAGFTHSDLSHMTNDVIDDGIIDYRRRKTGKVRRIIPLPSGILALLKKYKRAKPADERFADHVFLRDDGVPFNMTGKETESLRIFNRIQESVGIYRKGRSFTGLRTTCFNAIVNESALLRGVIFGRKPPAMSIVDWDNYLEVVDVASVRHIVQSVWDNYFNTEHSGA